MTIRAAIMKIVQQDRLNFLLTNRIPRRLFTRWVGWFSRIEHRVIVAGSLRVWRLFTDLDLSDAEAARFRSMHQCFTRRLKPGARPVEMDPSILASPCDAIVGASGPIADGVVLQIKDMPYSVEELLGEAGRFRDGCYVTLRLTSAMYHRFHAPHDCRVSTVAHFFGDVWNVNPATLQRVERLYCRNERAVIHTTLEGTGYGVTLVPVAAILVAGIRLAFLDLPAENRAAARSVYNCHAVLRKGDEMGWFEHGSTIVVFAPVGFTLCEQVKTGAMIRAGQPLMRLPA